MKALFLLLPIFILFTSCSDKNAPSSEENEKYSKMGMEIVQTSFAALSQHLGSALKNEGYTGAIRYCNINAYPIMDSLSKVYGVTIRRTSMKVRNPKDAPDNDELGALNVMMEAHKSGAELSPLVQKIDDSTYAFYAPIVIKNPLCLGCHGDPGESNDQHIFDEIKELYPDDEATGYKMGDFRGIWSVKFIK